MPRSRCQYSYEFRDRYYEDPPAAAATDGPDFRAAAARAKRMRFFKKGSGGGSPSAAVPLTVEAAEAEAVEAVEAAAEGGLSPSKTATLVAGGGDAASGGKGKRRRGGSANGNEEEVLIRAQIDPEVRCKIVERAAIKVRWVSRQTFRRIIAPLFCSFTAPAGVLAVAVQAARPAAVERALGGGPERGVPQPAQQPQPVLPLPQRKVSQPRLG